MRKLSYLLIIIGLIVLAYPTVSGWLEEREEAHLLEEMEAEFAHRYADTAETKAQDHFRQLGDIFDDPEQAISDEEVPASSEEEASPIAMLEIAKINLKLPVMEGATKENMRVGAAHMSETTAFGEVGNAAIAGHRMRKKGRIFNRLNEVSVGEEIIVRQQDKTFVYKVFQKSRVEPDDVSVLNRNNKDKILTLITCDPLVNPTHRIIIHAEME